MLVSAIALLAQPPSSPTDVSAQFGKTRIAAEAERLLRRRLGEHPSLRAARDTMSTAQLCCRPAEGRGRDSLLVCLGEAVRLGGVYSRMAFRISSSGDSVTKVWVCPALVASHRRPPVAALRARATATPEQSSCWRDLNNPADAEGTCAALAETGRFTTVPQSDAPRMRSESAASADPVLVIR